MPVLLAIDDDGLTLDCFRYLFPQDQVCVHTATSAAEGLRKVSLCQPDVVVLDVRLPDLSGLEAFQKFRALDPKTPIILMTGHASAQTAIEATRLGAYEYVIKPFAVDTLRQTIAHAFESSRLMRVSTKVTATETPDASADTLVGQCPAMQDVYKSIGRVASQDVTVLIRGESGTGKELVARAVYHYSHRANGPFLAVNCAAIPEALLESELFGHEKGDFTGADRTRIGKFEQSDKGTLFLDEIGDMTPLTQAKVLRVLQERRFERVGGNQPIQTDVRIIAATNRDLEAMIAAGTFRSDLYYRLNVYAIQLPPLRERGEDLQILAEHFMRRFASEFGKELPTIAPATRERLRGHSWRGNVRELQSVLKKAILQTTGPVLLPHSLPPTLRDKENGHIVAPSSPKHRFPDLAAFVQERLAAGTTELHAEIEAAMERQLFIDVLRHTDYNLSHAARILGLSRPTLRTKLGQLAITIDRSGSIE